MILFALLAPLLVGGTVYAMSAAAAARARNRPLPPVEEIAARMQASGFRRVIRVETDRARARTAPRRTTIQDMQEREDRAETRFKKHGAPVLDAHPHLVAYVMLLAIPAAIGLVMLNAGIALDVGLLQTLNIAETQARVVGTIIALTTGLIGFLILELLFPGEGIPIVKRMARPVRLGWAIGLSTAFIVVLAVLPVLATARAEARLGEEVDRAVATCKEVSVDPAAGPGERSLACSRAQRLGVQLERAKRWDALVAVAAPVGESVGLYALLRLTEVGVAGALALPVRRWRRRRTQAQAPLDHESDEFVALMGRAAERAGIPLEEFEEWRREVDQTAGEAEGQGDDGEGVAPSIPSPPQGTPEGMDETAVPSEREDGQQPPVAAHEQSEPLPIVSFVPPTSAEPSTDGGRWSVA